jgi:hypothetical protein
MVNPNRFYTYAYLREDRTPYYIGKGSRNRAYYKSKSGYILPPKEKNRIIFLKQNLTEQEAFKHEIYMIAVFGRKDLGTGILHNRTDGGDGASGLIRSEEWKRKQTKAKKGKYAGENHPRWNKKHTKESKEKMSKVKKGKSYSEETKRKQSEKRKGQNNPNYGKKWWNDGKGNNKMSIECPGKGWILGVSEDVKRKNSESTKKLNIIPPSAKDKKWWNDGKGNTKMSIECPGEGWFPGRGKIRMKDIDTF